MRGIGLLGAAAVLLLPGAQACSLTATPPQPAMFILWEPESGWATSVEVAARNLGAMCDLANGHDVEGRVLAWGDGAPEPTIFLYNATKNEKRRLGSNFDEIPEFTIERAHLYYLAGDRVHLVHLDGGGTTVVAPSNPPPSESLHGRLVLYWDGESPRRYSLFDALRGDWVFRDWVPDKVGLPSSLVVRHVSEPYLLLAGGARPFYWSYDWVADRWTNLTAAFKRASEYEIALDGSWAYVQQGAGATRTIERIHLADGTSKDLGRPSFEMSYGFKAGGGVLTFNYYWPPDDAPPTEPVVRVIPSKQPLIPTDVPGGPIEGSVLALAVAMLTLRWRLAA